MTSWSIFKKIKLFQCYTIFQLKLSFQYTPIRSLLNMQPNQQIITLGNMKCFIFPHLQQQMIRGLCLLIFLSLASSIRFNYYLPKYQIQCFHESVQKNSRFQIAIKGESSTYYLHVVDRNPLHEDSRTVNAQYKYYSAFANESGVLTFCIGNLGSTPIYFDIQFYHGIYLEDSFEEKVQGRQLEDLSDRWSQMLKMVESNYDIYRNQLLGRRATSQRITLVLTLMVAIIIAGTIIIKLVYYRKIVGYLKEKKAV